MSGDLEAKLRVTHGVSRPITTVWTSNTELNNSGKRFILENLNLVERISVCNVTENFVDHCTHCPLTCSYTNDVINMLLWQL